MRASEFKFDMIDDPPPRGICSGTLLLNLFSPKEEGYSMFLPVWKDLCWIGS